MSPVTYLVIVQIFVIVIVLVIIAILSNSIAKLSDAPHNKVMSLASSLGVFP